MLSAITLVSLMLLALGGTALFVFFRDVQRFRGKRIVTCPATKAPAGVEVNAFKAASVALVDEPRFVITACSCWPERENCGQACLEQIDARPNGTLVRNIVARWYRDRQCVYCRRPISDVHAAIAPALRGPDGIPKEWTSIAAEDLPGMLETAVAVCASCEVAEGFRARYPQLIIDRSDSPLRDRAIH